MVQYTVKLEWKTELSCWKDNVIPFAVEELSELLQDFRESDPSAGNMLHWTVEPVKKQK